MKAGSKIMPGAPCKKLQSSGS